MERVLRFLHLKIPAYTLPQHISQRKPNFCYFPEFKSCCCAWWWVRWLWNYFNGYIFNKLHLGNHFLFFSPSGCICIIMLISSQLTLFVWSDPVALFWIARRSQSDEAFVCPHRGCSVWHWNPGMLGQDGHSVFFLFFLFFHFLCHRSEVLTVTWLTFS